MGKPRRLIALVSLCLGVAPLLAGARPALAAADGPCIPDTAAAQAIQAAARRLQQAGVVMGDASSELVPPSRITRGQVAAVLVRALGPRAAAQAGAARATPAFADTAGH